MTLKSINKREEFAQRVRANYSQRYPKSAQLHRKGLSLFPNGVAQFGRMNDPFPPFFKAALGSSIYSVDGDELIDFWAGHFCMILGHNPDPVLKALELASQNLKLLQMGVHTELEAEVAETILTQTGDDKILFSTSGTLATMYATMIASAATGRQKILKIEGGWHGVQPWAMSGIKQRIHTDGRTSEECGGIPNWFSENVIVIPFNDIETANQVFSLYGHELAACIIELVLGNAGMVMAEPEFVKTIRKLCTMHGSAMIIDELVTGFRVKFGGLQTLFEIHGDISIYGKALSGGMPFACITGSEQFMSVVEKNSKLRVLGDTGTFTAHPSTLIAVKATLQHMSKEGQLMFDKTITKANKLKVAIKQSFVKHGICFDITGNSSLRSLEAFPIAAIRFITDEESFYSHPTALVHWDSNVTDIEFRNNIARLALMLKGVFSWQGLGVVTVAHSEEDFELTIQAYESFAAEIEGLFPKS